LKVVVVVVEFSEVGSHKGHNKVKNQGLPKLF
jgi:hypothetical protein